MRHDEAIHSYKVEILDFGANANNFSPFDRVKWTFLLRISFSYSEQSTASIYTIVELRLHVKFVNNKKKIANESTVNILHRMSLYIRVSMTYGVAMQKPHTTIIDYMDLWNCTPSTTAASECLNALFIR